MLSGEAARIRGRLAPILCGPDSHLRGYLMGGWLDRWAKRAADDASTAAPASEASAAPAVSSSSTSRRDFLKKAGIVGGAAWSIPVLQTVMAPAASASAGSVIGQPCSPAGVVCGDTSVCFGGLCGAPGATCSGGQPCFNSSCSGSPATCGGQNAACTSNANCAPGKTCKTVGGSQKCSA
jgi:hypothetical protein